MDQQQIFADMALKAWQTQVASANKQFARFSDDDLQKEVSPGRNRVIYLLGHLIAANDSMLSLFGAERLYGKYDEAFLRNADKSGFEFPDATTLRGDWQQSLNALHACFNSMDGAAWMGRHTSMTDEDHTKDPGRNRLSVLLNRTAHMAYHIGQIALVA